jgi:hypothetical protein
MRALVLLAVPLAAGCVHTPGARDIQAVETGRILAPQTDYTRDGRAYVEFAPTVETRGAVCTRVQGGAFECSFESRVRGFFDGEFGPWQKRREILVRRRGYWRLAP